MSQDFEFDEIGYWSEVELEIIKRYGSEYSKILSAQGFIHAYIDAFAGSHHIARSTKELVLGSPPNALAVEPPLAGLDLHHIHWVIVGGESGPDARPMHRRG